MSGLGSLARRYGFDAADRARGGRESRSRSPSATGADAPTHDARGSPCRRSRSSCCRCSRGAASPSRRRRRSGCWRRRSRSSTGGWSSFTVDRRPSPGWPRRSCSATCATPSQARLGLADRRRRRGDRRLQRPRATPPGELVFIPVLFAIGWLAGFALRERAEQAEAAEERALARRAGAGGGGPHRRRRGARADRARAPRHRRPRRQRDGAPGRRGPAQASRRRWPRTARRCKDVEQAGRAALAEMRRLLGAMRHDGEDVELAPQPGLDSLDALVERGRPGRPPVRLHVEGDAVPLPRAIDLSAYRIVQEGLTNALKHARASHADVTVRYAPDAAAARGPRRRRRRRRRATASATASSASASASRSTAAR